MCEYEPKVRRHSTILFEGHFQIDKKLPINFACFRIDQDLPAIIGNRYAVLYAILYTMHVYIFPSFNIDHRNKKTVKSSTTNVKTKNLHNKYKN